MYKVVIIDDEMIIRVGFKSFIDWNAEGFEMVGEASNGQEGMELCRKTRPHVVFTDIVMTRLDGLAFTEKLLQEFPGTKVIILSCMEEFSTLQKALRLGVRDYFLKLSFSPAQLIPLIRTLKKELDEETPGPGVPDAAQPAELSTYLRLQLDYRSYIEHRQSPDALPAHSRLSQAAMTGETTALILIRRDGASPGAEGDADGRTPMISILNEMFAREYRCDIVEISPGSVLLVCEGYLPIPREELVSSLRDVQSNLLRMMHCSASIGVSLTMRTLRRFYPAYQALCRLEDKRFYQGERALLIDEGRGDAYRTASKELNWGALADRVSAALEVYDFARAQAVMETAFRELARARDLGRRSVLDGITLSLLQYERVYQRSGDPQGLPLLEPQRSTAEALTLEELERSVMEYIFMVRQQVERHSRDAGMRMEIEKAKAYVRDHLDKSINARSVADLLGFNYSYFSVLFKKETGVNFSDYLIQERMGAAMRMLVETRMSPEEISNRVGYGDVSHFRKLFRNQFGLSVGEVRRHPPYNEKTDGGKQDGSGGQH